MLIEYLCYAFLVYYAIKARYRCFEINFVIMKRILFLLTSVLFVIASFAQADKAKYYIEGDYSISRAPNGQFVYNLTDISSKGIFFSVPDTLRGVVEEDESISFTFEKATTDCPDGFKDGLKFWKWQNNGKNYSWQRDSEVKDAQQNFETDKIMVAMLILDCSNSLGDANFAKLQSSAIKFLDILYNASPDGSVRIGIVGFNTMSNTDEMVRDIEPLTASSKDRMVQFIHGLTLYNNTSLYYAMRKGSDMIADYVASLPDSERDKFDHACMVSFTDGYDNHSKDERLGVPQRGLDNPYFQYIRDNVVNRSVGGKSLKSHVIAVKGNDVSEDNKLYKEVFQGISSEDPVLLDDFSQVEAQFEKMANDLIKRWQNLTCYVPSAHQGRVRWTIGDYTDNSTVVTKVQEKTQQVVMYSKKAFLGVNAGLDFEIASQKATLTYVGLCTGFDFAIPTKKKENIAMGGMLSLKWPFLVRGPFHLGVGPLMLVGDYENRVAFMLGAGLDLRFHNVVERPKKFAWTSDNKMGAGGTLRLGFTTIKQKLYFFTDLTLGGFHAFYKEPYACPDGPLYDESGNAVFGQDLIDRWGHDETFYYEPLGGNRPRTVVEQFFRDDTHPLYFNFSFNIGYRF